jgi:hypothetical protein
LLVFYSPIDLVVITRTQIYHTGKEV